MAHRRLHRSGPIGIAVATAIAVLSACTGGGSTPSPAAPPGQPAGQPPATGGQGDGGNADPAASIQTVPAADARDVAPAQPVTVTATNGTLGDVTLLSPSGRKVKGGLSADRHTWTSAEPLGYGKTYTLTAATQDGQARSTSSFTTVTPAGTIFPSFFPPPKITKIGIGQPVVVIFDKPPADRAAAERALVVTAKPAQPGSWYWWDNRTLHYRPQHYWKAGTKITVQAKVYGVNLGGGMYGETDRTLRLTVGQSKIAIVDDRTHMMTVFIDGKKVREIPVAMGRPGSVTVNGKKISFVTNSGIHVVQEKYPVKQMQSASFGLPANYSLGYDSKIPLAVRISNGGEFVHSAPWSVADQGHRNVSHGCVNINPAAAQWFYNTFGYGDIVDIRNTGAKLAPTDGFGDWNIPWSEWVKGSALR